MSKADQMRTDAINEAAQRLACAHVERESARERMKAASEEYRQAVAGVIQAESADYSEMLASVEP